MELPNKARDPDQNHSDVWRFSSAVTAKSFDGIRAFGLMDQGGVFAPAMLTSMVFSEYPKLI
jgi:hypothetical protein